VIVWDGGTEGPFETGWTTATAHGQIVNQTR